MAATVAVLATLAFIGWLIYRAVRSKPIKAHTVAYGVACVTGVFTLAYFFSMDIPQLIKILVSILLGLLLIIFAAYLQRRHLLESWLCKSWAPNCTMLPSEPIWAG